MFIFKNISIEEVETISKWSYPFMPTVYMKPYFDNFKKGKPLKGPLNCDGFSVFKEDDLFGLFEYYNVGKEIEIGLAISPKYASKGYSQQFLQAGIDFLIQNYDYQYPVIKLSVETENLPALKAYLKFGFEVVKEAEEIEMIYKIKER